MTVLGQRVVTVSFTKSPNVKYLELRNVVVRAEAILVNIAHVVVVQYILQNEHVNEVHTRLYEDLKKQLNTCNKFEDKLKHRIKSISWEYSCDEEYLDEFNK